MNNLGQANIFDNDEPSFHEKLIGNLINMLIKKLDRYIMYTKERWIFALVVYIYYFYRICTYGGYYVISYMLGLFLLHLTVQFFTPLGLPDIDDELADDLPMTSEHQSAEFKPMIRSVSEFKYWKYVFFSGLISVFCTFFAFFDIPVFWPFLLIYFLSLVGVTVKKHMNHMNKYGYSLFDYGKKQYQST